MPVLGALNNHLDDNVDVRKNLKRLVEYLRQQIDGQKSAEDFGDHLDTGE